MAEITLTLDPGEKGIIGDMTVINTSGTAIELAVEGEGAVLREKQIIKAEDAVSPALRIYYMVTQMYIAPGFFDENHKAFMDLSRELVSEVPSTGMIMADIGELTMAGDFQAAWEKCFDLLRYEAYLEQIATGEIDPPPELAGAGKKGGGE